MDMAIIAALISGAFTILAIYINNKISGKQLINKLETEVSILKNNQEQMKVDMREHNHYAKLFAENVPVLKEQYKEVDRRMTNIENKLS